MNILTWQIVSVAAGGALGAWMRWGFSITLNTLLPRLPLGTLAANLVGGFLMGFLTQAIVLRIVPAELQLFLLTGFLGGLTTFSTFSAEVVNGIRHRHLGWALMELVTHVMGSLLLTLAGIRAARALWG
jgi:CrcB protein